MKKIKKYLKVWWLMTRNSFIVVLSKRGIFVTFLIGKIIRFSFFFMFLFFILHGAKTLAGYSGNQVIFFFLTFNLIDIVSQFLFREVYRFQPMVVTGDFDFVLSKPISPLFRVLLGGADIVDLITIIPLIFGLFYLGGLINITFVQSLIYLVLILNAIVIAAAFHVIILSLAILTTEIDHTVLIYRDMTGLGRFPIEIYKQPLQAFLTYLIPIGVMVSVPVKAAIGVLSVWGILSAFLVGIAAIFIAFRFWNFALTKYTSASS